MFSKPKEKDVEASATPATPDLNALSQAGSSVVVAEPEAAPKPVQKWKAPAELLSPEAQAYTSMLINEAVKGVFAQMAPVLQSIALTPEKLAEAEKLRRAPTQDELAKKAREAREKKLTMIEQEENRQSLLRNQAACVHKYPTGMWAVNPVNNYPDRQPRFICSLCQSFFEPRRWVIGAPTAEEPRGHAYIADEHKQYRDVMQVLATKG